MLIRVREREKARFIVMYLVLFIPEERWIMTFSGKRQKEI